MSSIRNVAASTPVNAAQAVKAAPSAANAAKAPSVAGDSFQSSDVHVVTYNTAIGNSKIKTNQADFVKLPFYQKVINGDPNAPVMCLQEVGNAQIDAVKKLAKNGNFTVVTQHVGLYGRQNNMMLIPKRFKVQETESKHFGWSQVKVAAKSLWNWASSFGKKESMTFSKFNGLIEPRGYQKVKVIDTVTNKPLTLFNTHIAYLDELQKVHARDLFAAVKEAEKDGPVILGGDLNTLSAETDKDPNSDHAYVRAQMGDMKDMGPKGKPAARTNIDWVLAKGFDSVDSKWYIGDALSLPGSPNAETVSDHYAEEDVLRFE
jgi:endonuclease/exonuclease/phosphatase family metal-dependent hydrolase